MEKVINIKDRIIIELKEFKSVQDTIDTPTYIILGKESYELLKEAIGIPGYQDIGTYAGMMIHIRPDEAMTISFM